MLWGILIIVLIYGTYVLTKSRFHAQRSDLLFAKLYTPKGEVPILGHYWALFGGESGKEKPGKNGAKKGESAATVCCVSSSSPWAKLKSWARRSDVQNYKTSSSSSSFHSIMRLNILGTRVLYITEPLVIKRILTSNVFNYTPEVRTNSFLGGGGWNASFFLSVLVGGGKNEKGHSLLALNKEEWARERALWGHAFHLYCSGSKDVQGMRQMPLNCSSVSRSVAHAVFTAKNFVQKMKKNIISSSISTTGSCCDQKSNKDSHDGIVRIDLLEETQKLNFQMLMKMIFSSSCWKEEICDVLFSKCYSPVLKELHEQQRQQQGDGFPWRQFFSPLCLPWGKGNQKLKRCLVEFNDYLLEIIRQKCDQKLRYCCSESQSSSGEKTKKSDAPKESEEGDGLIDFYLDQWQPTTSLLHSSSSSSSKEAQVKKLLQQKLLSHIHSFLLIGMEANASMLTLAMHQLSIRKDLREKVQTEHEEVFGLSSSEPPNDGILSHNDGIPWASAVLQETLRFYSIHPIVCRRAVQDDVLSEKESHIPGGLLIAKDSVIWLGLDAVHHRPDLWGSAPVDVFHPERLRGTLGGKKMSLKTSSEESTSDIFLPFLAGPRGCPGKQLALEQMSIILSFFSYYFDIAKEESEDGDELEMDGRRVPRVPMGGKLLVRLSLSR